MDTIWLNWINEPIFVDKGTTNIQKRKHAYAFFCLEGLIPFLKSRDYFFEGSSMNLAAKLLRLVYHIYKGYRVEPISHEHDFEEDQFDLYCHTFDTVAWEHFWDTWEGFQDFEPGAFGHEFKTMLPTFVYSWLDLETSPPAYSLHQELVELMEEEQATKGRDDPYLQETHTRDYQDRHWH